MSIRCKDILPITEARAKVAELAEEVVRDGSEKILTKNGRGHVALIDAKRLDYYHALEAEQANLDASLEARKALEDVLAGRTLSSEELRARVLARVAGA